VTIFVAVIYVLEEANGPGTGPKSFAERRGYDQVKESMHQIFPLGFAVGVGGLGLIMLGTRMAKRAREEPEQAAKTG